MRHRLVRNHFNRNTNERKALLKSLLRNLVEQGEIVTTDGKAKEIKRLMDKLVYKAKSNTVETRRNLHKIFGRRDVVNTLVERVAPAMGDRVSGFTTISKLSSRRGDSAQMVSLKFVAEIDRVGTLKSGQTYEAKVGVKKVAKTAKVAKVAKTVKAAKTAKAAAVAAPKKSAAQKVATKSVSNRVTKKEDK